MGVLSHLTDPVIVVGIAITVLGLEVALILFLGTRRRGIARYVPNALSGLAILIALRIALADPGSWAIVACLVVSLGAHLADLAVRQNTAN